jgi:YHS domain-containing protein
MGLSRIRLGLVVVVFVVALPVALAQQHAPAGKPAQPEQKATAHEVTPLPLCPVMGESIDFNVKTMTPSGPVYFCCPMCIEKYEAEPAKYAAKVAQQRAALEKLDRVQVACPVSGKPIDGKTFATVQGQRVGFCCEQCVPEYEKDPAQYKAALAASYTYQTLCPVRGEKIDATVYRDLPTGERIYFCCNACVDKLLKDPAQYAPNLAKQGIHLDVKKLKAARDREHKSQPTAREHNG